MRKGRKNMYDMMVREAKNSKKNCDNFFLRTPLQEKETIKIVITQERVNSLGNDMQELADFMVKTILEGMSNGRG